MAILRDAILKGRREYSGARGTVRANVGHITVDTPVPYFLVEMSSTIEKGLGKLEKPGGAMPYQRLQARIEALKADERFAFMFSREPVDDTLADIVGNVLRIPRREAADDDHRPVRRAVGDRRRPGVADVPDHLRLRAVERRARGGPHPVRVRRGASLRAARRAAGFEPTRRAITRIAMEGRKYGVSLGLVSNRPSELSPTMLAQCNTIFAMRMSNQHDHAFVRSALPEGDAGLVGALPALRTQEAIAVGEGVGIPLRLRFDDLDEAHRPRSTTAEYSRAWAKADLGGEFVRDTITRWRHQRRGDSPVPVVKTGTGIR